MKKRALLLLGIVACALFASVPARADHEFVIQAFDASTNYGDVVTLSARLLDTDDNDCAGGPPCPESGDQVDFYVDGDYVGTDITNAGGFAYLLISVAQEWHTGAHEFRAQYDRHSLPANPATDTAVLTINREVMAMAAREGYFEAQLLTDDNEPVSGLPVRFHFNGPNGENDFCLAYTDFDGNASCVPVTGAGISPLDVVEYWATFDGNGDYVEASDSSTLL